MGNGAEGSRTLKDETHRFYKLIFSKRDWLRPTFLNGRLSQLSAEDANLLEIPVEEKEIWEAVNNCVSAVMWFWDTKEISRGCNSSFVALIPKSTDPIGLGEYRPISLIGCYYTNYHKTSSRRGKESDWSCMGFGDKWCTWIEACLKSSSMFVQVNGSSTAEFRLERGVRQGDPLSPFLFIVAAEGLNAMVNDAVDKGVFKGIKVGTNNVVVSHLQYADDTIFFGVNSDEVVNMARWMQCSVGDFPFTYLGLPIGECMRRESAWRVVVEKFRKRLCEWKAKTMSFWGRLTLVKSVLGSLPLYYFLSVLCALCMIVNTLGVLERDFFWGGVECKIKHQVGLNVGKCMGYNLSGKDGWIGRMLLVIKFPRLCHLDRCKEARVIDRGEWSEGVWRWEMDWEREPRGRACGDLAVLMDLLHSVNRTCDCRDSWQWNRAEDGKFKVKDLSHMVDDLSLQVIGSSQEMVWNKLVPKKVNIFIWRALNGRIPVRVELDKRGVDLDSVLCPCCGD
ncbi:reverse transcriptase domain, reverse transcriptase zinc-binding domain protein [Tanacetum coccineum]